MTAITISRQLGSLGDEVAQEIGKRLNYRVVSRELINQAAIRAGAPEMALAVIDDLGLLGLRPTSAARLSYQRAVQSVLTELADGGEIVIVGRAGQVILRDRPDVFHIKVIAPSMLRAERLTYQQGISLSAAQAQVTTSDHTRRNYLQRYYHVRWDDPELYDLIVNTTRLDPAQAACLVCQVLSQCLSRPDANA
jgi:cytidylate kinase